MNKLTKKISIHRETFRNLSTGQLGVARGGLEVEVAGLFGRTKGKRCVTTDCPSAGGPCPSVSECEDEAL